MVDSESDKLFDEENGRTSRLPESLRKALVTGLSAVFVTEEGIRNVLGDMRVPKDAIAMFLQPAENGRKELFGALLSEIKTYVKDFDVSAAIRKALVGVQVDIHAELHCSENEEEGICHTESDARIKSVSKKPKRKTKKPTTVPSK